MREPKNWKVYSGGIPVQWMMGDCRSYGAIRKELEKKYPPHQGYTYVIRPSSEKWWSMITSANDWARANKVFKLKEK